MRRDNRLPSGLRDRRGRAAKNPETGRGGPSGEREFNHNLDDCADTLDGEISIEIGGRAGAIVSVNPFANVAFAFSDPISFDYGVRVGVTGYIGAELYLQAAATGSGRLLLK